VVNKQKICIRRHELSQQPVVRRHRLSHPQDAIGGNFWIAEIRPRELTIRDYGSLEGR